MFKSITQKLWSPRLSTSHPIKSESGRLHGAFVIAALFVGVMGVAVASAGHGPVIISAVTSSGYPV